MCCLQPGEERQNITVMGTETAGSARDFNSATLRNIELIAPALKDRGKAIVEIEKEPIEVRATKIDTRNYYKEYTTQIRWLFAGMIALPLATM